MKEQGKYDREAPVAINFFLSPGISTDLKDIGTIVDI